jgi:hypothetical protein
MSFLTNKEALVLSEHLRKATKFRDYVSFIKKKEIKRMGGKVTQVNQLLNIFSQKRCLRRKLWMHTLMWFTIVRVIYPHPGYAKSYLPAQIDLKTCRSTLRPVRVVIYQPFTEEGSEFDRSVSQALIDCVSRGSNLGFIEAPKNTKAVWWRCHSDWTPVGNTTKAIESTERFILETPRGTFRIETDSNGQNPNLLRAKK